MVHPADLFGHSVLHLPKGGTADEGESKNHLDSPGTGYCSCYCGQRCRCKVLHRHPQGLNRLGTWSAKIMCLFYIDAWKVEYSMIDAFNYKILFDKALQEIKAAIDPQADKSERIDLNWNVVRQQTLFDFGGRDFKRFSNAINVSKTISISCLRYIIVCLLNQYHYEIEQLDEIELLNEKPKGDKTSDLCFAIKDVQHNTLLLFKEIEESNFWKIKDIEPEYITTFMRKCGVSSCKYVYLMYDYAYLQVIGHNSDESDRGRGYNVYSIKWFFETYFEENESESFCRYLDEFHKKVKEYLGFIFVKSLTPYTLIDFRKITENAMVKFEYKPLLHRVIRNKNKDYQLEEGDFRLIWDQFVNDKYLRIMFGKHDFAESFLTAEWLYHSMKMAKAIDLTVIGMGYFKAVEQLLFELICLHKNEGREITKNPKRKDILNKKILLNDDNIAEDAIDTVLNSLAIFYKENMDMFRNDLMEQAKEYIRETVFVFKNRRNGYFHKHNIHNWEIVDEIRDMTFYLIFLLLGAHALTEENKLELGIPSTNEFTDYYRLCEYVNYHCNELFFLDLGKGEEHIAISVRDKQTTLVNDSYIQYSGIYFKDPQKESTIFRFTEKCLPKKVHLGKLVFAQTESVKFDPVKVKKVFENGLFIGPSIAEEDSMDY